MKIKLYAASASLFCFIILCGLLSISFSVSANDSAYKQLAQASNQAPKIDLPTASSPTKPVQQMEKKTISQTKTTSQVKATPQTKTLEQVANSNTKKTATQADAAPKKKNDESVSVKKPNGETNLPTPRFVSIKSNEVNVRTGPGDNYPIKWVIIKKNLPVEIIAEFEHWRKIRDISGDEGWVHSAMVSGTRTAIILNKTWDVMSSPEEKAKTVATIEQGVVVDVNKCNESACEVRIENVDGWLPRTALWGFYKNEVIED